LSTLITEQFVKDRVIRRFVTAVPPSRRPIYVAAL